VVNQAFFTGQLGWVKLVESISPINPHENRDIVPMKKPPFIDWLVVLTCFSHLEKYESMGRMTSHI